MTNPKYPIKLQIPISKKERKRIKAVAKKKGVSVGYFARYLIKQYADSYDLEAENE